MKNIIQRRYNNVCSLFSSIASPQLAIIPRCNQELTQALEIVQDLDKDGLNFSINHLKKYNIKDIVIFEIDDTLLSKKDIYSIDSKNIYHVDDDFIKQLSQFDASSTLFIMLTNHFAEDSRPIYQRSVSYALDHMRIKIDMVFSILSDAVYLSKAYLLMMIVAKLSQQYNTRDFNIHIFDSDKPSLYGMYFLVSNIKHGDDMYNLEKIIKYYNVSLNDIYQCADTLFYNAKYYYLLFKTPALLLNVDQILEYRNYIKNQLDGLMILHIPIYALIFCE